MRDFPTVYQELIYKSRYSRWNEAERRREKWGETVDRYYEYFKGRVPSQYLGEFWNAVEAIKNLHIMPSMRCLWTAGPALDNDNIAGYNCAYLIVDSPAAFSEALYVLMNGTGLGYSVERQFINKLPVVPYLTSSDVTVIFKDSKLGWAEGFKQFIKLLYHGVIPKYDLSKIRPKGAILKTFGGRASGPDPLRELLDYSIMLFKNAQGRRLNSIECHDLMCMVANCVVVGGVRRSAMISLSNLTDQRMRHAKDGEFWMMHPYRSLSNNSVIYTEKPDIPIFMEEMLSLIRSGTGERGIVNREALYSAMKMRGREPVEGVGLNPCGEIILRPQQFCNLTEVVVRPEDDLVAMSGKVRLATILGVIQSTLTDFKFISKTWKNNCEEERLLGVSLTGLQCSRLGMNFMDFEGKLAKLEEEASYTAIRWAKILGINPPKAVTCVKPSGTVSQLVGTTSGIHTGYSPYYIRRVRQDITDPITKMLMDKGVHWNPEVGQTRENMNVVVFDFPMSTPKTAVFKDSVTAVQQLEYWRKVKERWCHHNPSATIYVAENEWLDVAAWVYRNWGTVAGLAFLPKDGGVYSLAPYEEITAEKYTSLLSAMPEIDFDDLSAYEGSDLTTGAHEYACVGNSCEI